MSLVTRLRAAWHAMADRPNELTTSEELDRWIRHGGRETDSGVPVTVANAQGLAAVAACVRVLSNGAAQLPLQVFARRDGRRSPDRESRIYRLLHDQPNAVQTSFQWRKLCMRDLLLRGDCFSLKVPGLGGEVSALLRLHPDQVRVRIDAASMLPVYDYLRPDGSIRTFPREQMFHLWMESDDGVSGLNPIQVYRQNIADGIAIRSHGSRFFSNGAKPLGVIQYEGEMGKEARAAFREDWEETYAGGANAHKTLLLPDGLKYNPVSITMEDAQWIESRKITAREIFGIFGIPPHKAGDLADATFSNIEHENLDFVTSSLMPWLVCWEQGIKRDLLDGDPNRYAKHNVSALMRGDFKSRQEGLQIMRRNGVINANQWLDLEDMNERDDPGGDVYIVEGNMQPNDGGEAAARAALSPQGDNR